MSKLTFCLRVGAEFTQLAPVKRQGNRRYYPASGCADDSWNSGVSLYDQGYTIGGAKQKLEGSETKDDSAQSRQLIHAR